MNYAYFVHLRARAALLIGDNAAALEWLTEVLRLRYFVSPAWLRVDPTWRALRGDP